MNDNTAVAPEGEKSFYKKLIGGELGLAKTYWVYGVGVGILLRIFEAIAVEIDSDILLVSIGLFSLVYFVVIAISIFRASEKYKGPKVWKILAQLAVVLGVISIINAFLNS